MRISSLSSAESRYVFGIHKWASVANSWEICQIQVLNNALLWAIVANFWEMLPNPFIEYLGKSAESRYFESVSGLVLPTPGKLLNPGIEWC
jgi:hypothetical protein